MNATTNTSGTACSGTQGANQGGRGFASALRNFALTSIMAASTVLAMPTQAATINSIQSKVNAIKSDSTTIKSRTSSIISKANVQLRETADIKTVLEPLVELRARFEQIGVTPGGILDMIPADELATIIEDIAQEAQEARERLTDPDLETFRQEFVAVLSGLGTIAADNDIVEVSQLEALVELAPPAVLAIVKAATESSFLDLQSTVQALVDQSNQLRSLGAVDLINVSGTSLITLNNNQKQAIKTLGCQTADGFRPGLWLLSGYRIQLAKATQMLKDSGIVTTMKGQKDFEFGVHGYLGFKFKTGSNLKIAEKRLQNKLERKSTEIAILQQFISGIRSGITSCELYTVFSGS